VISGQRSINILRQASEQDLIAVLQLHRADFPAEELAQIIEVVQERFCAQKTPLDGMIACR